MSIRRIEVDFAIPVEVSDKTMQELDNIVQHIAKANEPDGMVHWASGCGSKPHFSRMDALFLGKVPEDGAPDTGEPTWDDSTLQFETTCRQAWPEELERKRERQKPRPWWRRIKVMLKWYDAWVGVYVDVDRPALYVCPIPFLAIRIDLKRREEPQ